MTGFCFGENHDKDAKICDSGTTTTSYWNKYYSTQGATSTLYIYAGDMLVGTVEGNGVATTTQMIHTDHLGGTNVTSDTTGNLAQLNTYYPFGSIRQNDKTGTTDTKRKYIGQYYDDATSLSYLNARYYEGSRGQFLSQDPLVNTLGVAEKIYGRPMVSILANPQELNTYSYALNNPINKSDPTGLTVYAESRSLGVTIGGKTITLGSHMYLRAVPNDPQQLLGSYKGLSEFTLGGYNPNALSFMTNKLEKGVGTADKPNADFKNTSGPVRVELVPPKGMSDSAFINQITQTFDSMNDMQSYSVGAYSGGKNNVSVNSNNLAYTTAVNGGAQGFKDSAGKTQPLNTLNPPGWTPGWGNVMPTQAQQSSSNALYYTNAGGR